MKQLKLLVRKKKRIEKDFFKMLYKDFKKGYDAELFLGAIDTHEFLLEMFKNFMEIKSEKELQKKLAEKKKVKK